GGRVELARAQPAEGCGDLPCAYPGGIEKCLALDQLDRRAAGRDRGSATLGLERGASDPVPCDLQVDPHEIAARRTAGRAGAVGRVQTAASARRGEMVLQGVHRGEDYGPSLPLPAGS